MRSNEFPRKTDKLFRPWNGGPKLDTSAEESWLRMGEAYRGAADQLSDWIQPIPEHCAVLIPVLYLYRHYLELTLKSCIELALIHGRRDPADLKQIVSTHGLSKLTSQLRDHCDDLLVNPKFAEHFRALVCRL